MKLVTVVIVAIFCCISTANAAISHGTRCLAQKYVLSGTYINCLLRSHATYIKSGDVEKYVAKNNNCRAKLLDKSEKAEAKAQKKGFSCQHATSNEDRQEYMFDAFQGVVEMFSTPN